MKAKVLATVGITAATALLVAGCSNGATQSGTTSSDGTISGQVTMEFDAAFKSSIAPAVAEFAKKYPKATLKVNYVGGGNILTLVSTQAQAGTLPDIFLTVPGPTNGAAFSIGVLGSKGTLADLSDTDWASDIPTEWRSSVAVKNKIYAYPGVFQGLGAIYNTTLLTKLGLTAPTTWSDLITFCGAAKSKGVYAFGNGLGGDGSSAQMPYIDMIGSLGFGPDPKLLTSMASSSFSFADSPWKDVFTKYKEMGDAGCFGTGAVGRDRTQALSEVASGHAIAMVDVGAQIGTLKTQAPSSEFSLAPLPVTDSADSVYYSAAPGYTFSVSAKSKNLPAAKAFLAVLNESANITTYATAFTGVPVVTHDDFTPPATLKTLADGLAAGKGTNYAEIGLSGKEGTVAQKEVQKLILGQHTVAQVLAALQAAHGS